MNVNPNILRRETVSLIQDIDKQIEEVRQLAKRMNTEPHKLRVQDGWAMTPLLLAKATAYSTLVHLQDKK